MSPKLLWQYVLPHHTLSRWLGRWARCRCVWLKNALITVFIRRYHVDMSEAETPHPRAYPDFNAFFTRALKAGARPIASSDRAIACPVDGTVSACGELQDGRLLQAKGMHYTVEALLGGDTALAARFHGGHFATLYLAPRDYHRVHMPIAGQLKEMIYVPGRLFSVNPATVVAVPNLFARNERVVCIFETEAGAMAVILVGAMVVAGIATVWAGEVAPQRPREIQRWQYNDSHVGLARGAELGRFQMGSTAIILFECGKMAWSPALSAGVVGVRVKMGQAIGDLLCTT